MVGKIFNLSRKLYIKKIPLVPKLLWTINRVVFACDIPYTCDIHSTVTFQHNGLGVVIHNKTRIGENSVVLHNVTIGGNMGKKGIYENQEITYPIVGKNALIGTGAKILGPVVVGDNVQIGAGSIVLNNIPDNSVVIGVPAKIVRTLDS